MFTRLEKEIVEDEHAECQYRSALLPMLVGFFCHIAIVSFAILLQ